MSYFLVTILEKNTMTGADLQALNVCEVAAEK